MNYCIVNLTTTLRIFLLLQRDFSSFFDTSPKGSRRKCYLAPERFFDVDSPAFIKSQPLAKEMDIFAVGCVLAELFADGTPLFEYSDVLEYRRGRYDPGPSIIEKLGDTGIGGIVKHMTQINSKLRYDASKYLDLYVSSVMLDPKVTDVVHPFLASTLGMEANKRAESVAAGYPAIMKQLENGSGGATDVSGAVFSLQQVTTPVVDDGEALAENLTEESKNISFAPGDLHNQAAFLLAETRASVQAAGDGGIETDRSPAQTKQPPAVVPVSKPLHDSKNGSEMLSCNSCEAKVRDGMVCLLSLLCAVLRGSRQQSVRVRLVEHICDCALRCGDDDARLQRAVPQLVAAATDPQFAAVRCAALRALPRVLACVSSVQPGDARAFADYLLPSLSLLPSDAEPFAQATYAGVLARVAKMAQALLEGVAQQEGSGVRYDEELGRLRGAVERAVHDLLVGSSPQPKLSLLPQLGDLAATLGRRDTSDGLLPALLTLFNAREWQLRASLYVNLLGVCQTLGLHGVAFLQLFLDQMLSDPEPAGVAAAMSLLAALCRADLLQQRHIVSVVAKIIKLGLLTSRFTAVRAAAVNFISAAATALPRAVEQARLLPLLRSHLREDSATLRSPQELAAAINTGNEVPNSQPQTRAPSLLHVLPLPSTSYTVALNASSMRQGASFLSAALQQATQVSKSNSTVQGNVSLLLASAQRNLARSEMPGVEQAAAVRPAPAFSALNAAPVPSIERRAAEQEVNAISWRPRGVLVAHLSEHKGQITRLASLPGIPLFVSASEDGTVKLWDARRLERDISFRPRESYEGHSGEGVQAVVALEDCATIVSGGAEGSVHAWRVERRSQGEGWSAGKATEVLHKSQNAGPVKDLCSWGPDMVVVSRAGTGVVALDLRSPAGQIAWRLPCPPSAGPVNRLCCSSSSSASSSSSTSPLSWIVTGTSRGALSLWDVRYLLPVSTWKHPKGESVDAMALRRATMPPSSAGGAPVIYVAAGNNEICAWDAATGSVKEVFRLNNGDAPQTLPDFLAAPAQDLVDGAGDPLARGRQLGATELRTQPARGPGFRALLSGAGPQLLTGGTDCAVRCWDMADLQQSYMVVAAPPALHDHAYIPQWQYTTRMVGQVTLAEEHRVVVKVPNKPNDPEVQKEQLVAARWWDRAASLGHQQTVVDLAHVEGHSEPLLASASLDGSIKIWR
jgi:phosphoinositide-3-kinase regulatory subunit 4